jgi:hypothetical protein
MGVFTPAEISYLQSQRLGRIATAGRDGQPHVVPVSFHNNPEQDTIDVGGHDFAMRKKFRDIPSAIFPDMLGGRYASGRTDQLVLWAVRRIDGFL